MAKLKKESAKNIKKDNDTIRPIINDLWALYDKIGYAYNYVGSANKDDLKDWNDSIKRIGASLEGVAYTASTKKSKVIKSKAIRKDWAGEVGDRLSALFDRTLPDGTPLVPSQGDASTDIGQLVRGMNTLIYRYYNDGDVVGIGDSKDSLDWVIDYMENASDGAISSAIENFYDKYSEYDIDFENMDRSERQDYVNEALGTDFSE